MMKRHDSLRLVAVLVLCAGCALGLEGCGKKKPKPAPPPPKVEAEPPPPPQVSFDSISQEMNADPRVQFGPDLTLEDPEIAKAVVALADSFAKGDASAIRRVVSKEAQPTIEALQEMGGLSSDVEAVRVVFIGKNDESDGFKSSLDDINRMFSGEKEAVEEADRKITTDVARQIGALMLLAMVDDKSFDVNQFMPPMTAEKLNKFKEAWEKLRNDPAKAGIVEQIAALLSGSSMIPGLKNAEYMALIAVQTPSGVELTGWGIEKAFGKWTFQPAATDRAVKTSAAEWDNIGIAGFSADSRAGIPKAAAPKGEGEGDATTDDTKTDEGEKKDENDPGEQQKPPTEKRTPGGPVKIPGGG